MPIACVVLMVACSFVAGVASEMVGLGAANLAAGLFQGFPISSSSSRTPVAEAAGARTQLSGVVGALAIALLLVAAPSLLKDLPNTALAATSSRRRSG